jgi:hypothetical protein
MPEQACCVVVVSKFHRIQDLGGHEAVPWSRRLLLRVRLNTSTNAVR